VVRDGEFEREMIKGSPERMHGVPNDKREIGGWWFGDLGPDDCLTRLGIDLRNEGVRARPEPSLLQKTNVFYVLARPIELL
jgi:hypothetical protein